MKARVDKTVVVKLYFTKYSLISRSILSDAHFESLVGVSTEFCSMSSMKDHHQFDNDNDLAVHNTTGSINQTYCLFHQKLKLKLTLFKRQSTLSQPRWISWCHTWA